MTTGSKRGTNGANESLARSTTKAQLLENSYIKVLNKYKEFLSEQVITYDDLTFIPDPNVRRAVLAKAARESGGKNVGELSYRTTPNERIRQVLPQLKKYSDAELNSLKQDDQKFFDVAYKNVGGYQYRGRGPIQITGIKNYQELDKQLGLKGALVKDPDLILKDPAIAKAATVQYLKNAGLDKYQAKDPRDAAQIVIQKIGGKAYAPGTKLGQSELSAVEKIMPVVGAGATSLAQTTTMPAVKPPAPPTPPIKPAPDLTATTTPPAKPGIDVATTTTTVPGADMVAAVDRPIVPKDTKLLSSPPPGVNFKDVFDMPAYLKATDREDMTKFIKSTPAGQAYKKSLSERYELFKKQNNNQLN